MACPLCFCRSTSSKHFFEMPDCKMLRPVLNWGKEMTG